MSCYAPTLVDAIDGTTAPSNLKQKALPGLAIYTYYANAKKTSYFCHGIETLSRLDGPFVLVHSFFFPGWSESDHSATRVFFGASVQEDLIA